MHQQELHLFPSQVIMKQLIEEAKLFDSKGIFHRDLKLENILVNTNSVEPRIWVIDFGVGCFFTQRSVYRVFQGQNFSFTLIFTHLPECRSLSPGCAVLQEHLNMYLQSIVFGGDTGLAPPRFGSSVWSCMKCSTMKTFPPFLFS